MRKLVILGCVGIPLVSSVPARGQAGDFNQPQVVLETGGHQAPPRVIRFTPDGRQMLSAGMDKVIRVWNLDEGRPRLSRILRPPIWRGPAGTIYAMALSTTEIPGEPGQRYLAVAGYGVVEPRGWIELYRFPGAAAIPTGDILGVLPDIPIGQPPTTGHRDTVAALAFAPDGRTLASAGLDGQIILWDLATKTQARVIANPSRAGIETLCYSGDGQALVAGDIAGIVRVWNPATGQLVRESRKVPGSKGPHEEHILGLAVNPVGPLAWVIVGREDGVLLRYDAPELTPHNLPVRQDQGPVEAIAVDPRGEKLLTSIVARRIDDDPGRVPFVDCDIELRSLPDGAVRQTLATTDNLVYAAAFGPDGRLLAYGGGDAQALYLHDLGDPRKPRLTLAGEGRSIWELAWQPDSRSVAYRRTRNDPQADYEAFDLFDRRLVEVDRARLSGPVRAWNQYRVRTIDFLRLALVDPTGAERVLALDPLSERRWWSYSFLPPGPGHPQGTLAVGCEAGVVIFDLESGRRNRLYSGHGGPVYALAPSPDGRWLATGSSDQTVRIWRLTGCDRLAALGMTIRQQGNGDWTVATVDRLGFADRDRMQLKADDIIDRAFVGREEFPKARMLEFLQRANEAPPNTTIQMLVRRNNQIVPALTTKRDAPVLSLFVGLDREWVFWMPQGYYETSTAGDRRYLVWHRNGINAAVPTDTFPADRFEAELRLPAVLTILLTTGDLAQALAAVPPVAQQPEGLVASGAPPIVRIGGIGALQPDQPVVVNNPAVLLTLNVQATDGRSPISQIRVQTEGQTIAPVLNFNPPVAQFAGPVAVTLPPGLHRLSVVAINAQNRERVESVEVLVTAPPARPARLALLAIGVKGPFSKPTLKAIPFADLDAVDVRSRLNQMGSQTYREHVILYPVVSETSATASALLEAFHRVEEDNLGAGDTLMVLLESHYITGEGDPLGYFVGTDSDPGRLPSNAVPAELLSDLLCDAARRGCRVIVLVDAVHESAPRSWSQGFQEWTRRLSRRDVITFIASNQGPSQRLPAHERGPHGAFALGIIESFTARGVSRPWVDPASAFTLDDFQATVIRRVQELTRRKQQAACYFPETVSPRSPLFDPRSEKTK